MSQDLNYMEEEYKLYLVIHHAKCRSSLFTIHNIISIAFLYYSLPTIVQFRLYIYILQYIHCIHTQKDTHQREVYPSFVNKALK